jgi:hypothetical protein
VPYRPKWSPARKSSAASERSNSAGVERIRQKFGEVRPLLAGKSPEVIGAALAQLLAIFVASHAPPLRDGTRKLLMDCCDGLVTIAVEEMIEAGRAPPEQRGAER